MNLTDPNGCEQQFPNCDILNGDVNLQDIDLLIGLLGGNGGLRAEYTWNAENRLVQVAPPTGTEQGGSLKVAFAYDYRGRRIEKKVYNWNEVLEQWEDAPAVHRTFVWSGWKLLMELECEQPDCGTGFQPVRSYTWGLDLAGQNGQVNSLEGAGTIGGLLAMCDQTTGVEGNAVYLYDGNGNVTQLVAWAEDFGEASGYEWHADRLLAHYEYDPYGNVVN